MITVISRRENNHCNLYFRHNALADPQIFLESSIKHGGRHPPSFLEDGGNHCNQRLLSHLDFFSNLNKSIFSAR